MSEIFDNKAPKWLPSALRCPCCRGRLDGEWSCLNETVSPRRFPTTSKGIPILIDFERSALDEKTVTRPVAPGVKAPSFLRRVLRPFASLTNGKGGVVAMKKLGALLSSIPAPRVLMVGGGERWEGLDQFLAATPSAEIVNSDVYPGASVHVLTDAHQLAFADETFDVVIIQAVLEHLIEPFVAVEEFWRILKPNGLVLADTPFLQAVHMGAYDFTRYTPLGQRALFKRFQAIEIGISAGPMSSLRWAVEHGAKSLFRTRVAAWILRPFTLPLGWIEQFSSANGYALDACCGSYFIGRKSDRIMTHREIVAAYRGAQ